MRLTQEHIKQSILHSDREVRDAAINYFAKSFSPDPAIMPLAIQVIEQEGWNGAFDSYSFVEDLKQTDETISWLIGQLKQVGDLQGDDEGKYPFVIAKGFVHADVDVLLRFCPQLLDLDELNKWAKDAIRRRIHCSFQSPDDLWRQLTNYCTKCDKLNKVPNDLALARDLVEALGSDLDFSAQKVLPILNGDTDDAKNWIEVFAVRLAGEVRLHKAVAPIVKLLETADDWIFEEGEKALMKIGGDGVFDGLAEAYPSCDFGFRIVAAAILENIHTDLSVQTCLRLFETEDDKQARCSLLQAALRNFSTLAIEPARQFILATPLSPEVLEVRTDLLVACKLMGESFPEFEEWSEDSKHDVEFRRNWYRTNPFISHSLESEEVFGDEEVDEFIPPPDTIVREVHVGRNDPCPCGSGKKFKKCCLGKENSLI